MAKKIKTKALVFVSDIKETSQTGINLIKFFEGFREKAYLCPAGIWTVGYGTTRIDDRAVNSSDRATEKQAEEYLKKDLLVFENAVNELVSVELNQNKFDALVSFVYNIGVGNFQMSTLLKLLNARKYSEAAAQFVRWNKASGKVLSGLTKRREAEKKLFLAE